MHLFVYPEGHKTPDKDVRIIEMEEYVEVNEELYEDVCEALKMKRNPKVLIIGRLDYKQ